MPQAYQTERGYINTFMKLLFYYHAKQRFDLPKKDMKNKNLLVFFADEAQGVVTSSEGGTEGYKVIDKIREAKATVVFATQSTTSYLPILGKEKTKVLLLNLSNHIYFTVADSDAATMAADCLGKKEFFKRSHGASAGRGSCTYNKVEEYKIKPYQLMKLKKFQCFIKHCEKGIAKAKLKYVK